MKKSKKDKRKLSKKSFLGQCDIHSSSKSKDRENSSTIPNVKITKTLEKKEELFVQFTPQEMVDLGIKPGDLFEITAEDGQIILRKGVPVDLEIGDWSREILESLIVKSIEEQKPVDEIIRQILKDKIEEIDKLESQYQTPPNLPKSSKISE